MEFVTMNIQCLRGKDNELVVKEFAFVYTDESKQKKKLQSFLFESPYEESELPENVKRTNQWVTNNLHGIKWTHGHLSQSKFRSILKYACSLSDNIYAKGSDQTAFLSLLSGGKKIVDLDVMQCPKADDLKLDTSCGFPHDKHCALNKSIKYASWISAKKRRIVVQTTEQWV